MNALAAGLLAGAFHVVSGPDHLAAVAPLAIRQPRGGLRIGAAWGVGHASGALAVGLLAVLVRSFVAVEVLSSYAELLVGFVLVAIGGWAMVQAKRVLAHSHPHVHAGGEHGHAAAHGHPHEHVHVHDARHPHDPSGHRHSGRGAFGVGFLHGAAGTGHLLGVLPALALPTGQAIVYLLAYGVAAIGAMAAFGVLMGLLGHRLQGVGLRRALLLAGAAAVLIGLYWIATGWPA